MAIVKVKKKPASNAGRKKIIVDWSTADNLLKAGCPGTEVAAHLGIAPISLYRRCKEDKKVNFDVYCQEKREAGNAMIRVKQFQAAMELDKTMLIWLGKQRLNQSEKQELTGKDGKELDITPTVIIIPSNNRDDKQNEE